MSLTSFDEFFESAPIAIHCVDADGTILRANRAELAMLGYADEEYVGRHVAEFHADPTVAKDMLRRLVAGEALHDRPAGLICKDGSIKHVLIDSNALWDGDRFVHARCFTRDVTALHQAQAANRSKDEFLAILSHELRTPLTAILGWARLGQAGVLDPARIARALETIERNARFQAKFIDDLMDISRIVAGKLAIDRSPVDLAQVVDDAVDAVKAAADAKSVSLVARVDRTSPVVGDAERLEQVVANLLSNAVKFTDGGGRVELTLGSGGDGWAEIQVRDTGAGIDPAFLPHVFERFRQSDSTSRRGGLGLGLAIVRHLVEAHGGTVRAESGGRGQGATFTVRLPVREAVVPVRATAARNDGSVSFPRLDGVRALVVEDDPDTRRVIAVALRECGAEVVTAASVEQARGLIETATLDLVVSDIAMPGEDGYALIRHLRTRTAGAGARRLRAIAVTAFAATEDRARSLDAGFDLHLPKPLDPFEFTTAVARLLAA